MVIVSSDKDLMQLVNEQVCLLDPVKNAKICRAEVIEKFGLGPEKVIEIQALAGDSVDNVPGAPGIGIKTAAQLLTEYGDLDTLLERAHEIKQPKRRETLMTHADQVRLSRELVRLATDAPVPVARRRHGAARLRPRRARPLPDGDGVQRPRPAGERRPHAHLAADAPAPGRLHQPPRPRQAGEGERRPSTPPATS